MLKKGEVLPLLLLCRVMNMVLKMEGAEAQCAGVWPRVARLTRVREGYQRENYVTNSSINHSSVHAYPLLAFPTSALILLLVPNPNSSDLTLHLQHGTI
jgi:hypothetical protein